MASLASLASKSSGPEMSMPPSASRVTPVPNVPLDNGGNNNWDTAAHRTAPFVPPPQRDWTNMTRTIAHYERIEQIGEGTYGQVYRARCKDTNQIVALKKIRVHHGGYWGMPPTVIREIKILKRLRHPNLVKMVEVVSSKGVEHLDEDDEVEEKHKLSKKDRIIDAREGYKGNLFLVLEYVSHDLTGLMDVAYRFTEVQVKCIFKQLLEALEYMHENKYIHRDIKSSNILIDHNFRVKLADFGLARSIEPPILDKIHDRGSTQEFTNKVITLWYRPPEILLGATRYGTPVDVWSAGCILAELILGKPLFTGKTEMDQLQLIFEMLGTPTTETWDGFEDLKLLRTGEVTIETTKKAKLREKYQHKMPGPALNLLEKLLELDPQKRLTASRALNSRYFLADPKAPDQPEDLGPLLLEGGHFHEFQTKKKRREAKIIAEKAKVAALESGQSSKVAQEAFDQVYRDIMEKVAKEGIKVPTKFEEETNEESEGKSKKDPDSSRKDRSERKKDRSSPDRSRDKDRESRRERDDRNRDEKDKKPDRLSGSGSIELEDRTESRRRDEKDKDRDKDRSSRSRRDPEGHHERRSDDERRKKRRREDGDKRSRSDSRRNDSKSDGKSDGKAEKTVDHPKVERTLGEPKVDKIRDEVKHGVEDAKERNGGEGDLHHKSDAKDLLHKSDIKDAEGDRRAPERAERPRSSRRHRDRDRSKSRDRENRERRPARRDREGRSSRRRSRDRSERDKKRDRSDRDRSRSPPPRYDDYREGERQSPNEYRERGPRSPDRDLFRGDRGNSERGREHPRKPPQQWNGPPPPHRGGDDFGHRPFGAPGRASGGPPPDFRGPPPPDYGPYGPSGDRPGAPPPGHYGGGDRRQDGERRRDRSRDRGRDRR